MATKTKKKNSGPGNPATRAINKDATAQKLFVTMKNSVELVRDLKDVLPEEHFEWLRASSLGLMLAYSEITGLPSPMDYIEMDVAHEEKKQEDAKKKSICPICKNDPTKLSGRCIACGVDYSKEKK